MHFMGKCEFCGEEVLLPFECSFCNKHFCNEHRLPENHDCIEAPRRTPLGPWHAKKSPKSKLIKTPSKKSVASEGTQTAKKRPIKKILVGILAVVIIGFFLWYLPTITSIIQSYLSQASYNKITVLAGQPATYEYDNNVYGFGYKVLSIDPPDKFVVSTGFDYRQFSTVEDARYEAFGLEIVVSEVHSDYIVLLVKPVY